MARRPRDGGGGGWGGVAIARERCRDDGAQPVARRQRRRLELAVHSYARRHAVISAAAARSARGRSARAQVMAQSVSASRSGSQRCIRCTSRASRPTRRRAGMRRISARATTASATRSAGGPGASASDRVSCV